MTDLDQNKLKRALENADIGVDCLESILGQIPALPTFTNDINEALKAADRFEDAALIIRGAVKDILRGA